MTNELLGYSLSYDELAGALYIKLSDQQVHKTKTFSDRVNVDVDEHGEPVGVEIFD
jgi:uncharacterized protein YuzE